MRFLPLCLFIGLSLPLCGAPPPAPYDPLHDTGRPIAATPSLSPAETAAALVVPPGFSVEVIAGEPDLRQPVAHTMDDRGRLWVLENTNYPNCPGEPKDRILILEDTQGKGKFDKQTVFYDKLTFSSGIAVGFGGVYVGAPPNLLFIPDRDGDGVPDGEPQVLLDGWGNEDRHETLNDFSWGPDGWLYGTQGVFTFSNVGAPGTPDTERVPVNAAVWRFHPQTKKFERYCEGASNQWGIDWNDHGQSFFAACVIPHVWQCIQGARYQRQAGKPSNPYTYDDIKTIGGFEYEKRAYCGAMVYLGGLFPPELRDTFFFHDIHMNKMRNERMVRDGSGYRAEKNLDFVVSRDPWFRGLSPQYGPDGGVFVNDWYDKVPCYQQRDFVDRTNGRLYKIGYTGLKPTPVDLTKATSTELVQMQLSPNDWYVRHARRLLQERGPDPEVQKALEKMVRENPDDTRQLRALWALHGIGGVPEPLALEQLASKSEYVRGWMIQMLCENGEPSPAVLACLVDLAKTDPSPLVRLYLASAAGRLGLPLRWPILNALAAHVDDAGDHNLPLLLWYAAEPAVADDLAKGAAFLSNCELGKVQEYVARRMTSTSLAGTESPALPLLLKALAEETSDHRVLQRLVRRSRAIPKEPLISPQVEFTNESFAAEFQANILRGINAGLKGQRNLPEPAEWPALYASLRQSPREELREQALALAVTFGSKPALEELSKVLAERTAPVERRRAALDSLVSAKYAPAAPLLLATLTEGGPLRGAALRALPTFDEAGVPTAVLAAYPSLSSEEKRDALATLTARPVWARELLAAIDRKAVARTEISAPLARQLQDLKDPEIDAWLAKNWGSVHTPAADKLKEIARLKGILTPAFMAQGDSAHGRTLFTQTCALCHTIFGAGAKIGPELPGAFEDIDYLLQNIVDPNAIIGKDYQQNLIQTKDGQTLAGIVAAEDANTISLKSLAGPVTIQRADIAQQSILDVSLMPEGLLAGRSEGDIRDLFTYLSRHGQVPMLADASNANDYFNGTDLAHWIPSSPAAWKVESGGIIIGRGEAKPVRLDSDMLAKAGRCSFEISVRGEQAKGALLLNDGGGRALKTIVLRANGLTGPDGLSAAGPGPYEVTVTVGQPSTSATVQGNAVAIQLAAKEADGVVLGFEVEGANTELLIKKLRFEAAVP